MKMLSFLNSKEKRRRGAALELAIGVMVIAILACAAMVSVFIYQANRVRLSYKDTAIRAELDAVGNSFCLAASGENGVESLKDFENGVDEKFKANTFYSETTVDLIVTDAEKGDTLLTVSLKKNDGGTSYTVTEWKYH